MIRYDEREHDRALHLQSKRWHEMHDIGERLGRDSDAYHEARDALIIAVHEVQRVAPRGRRRTAELRTEGA